MKWRWKSDPQLSLVDLQLDDDSSGEGWGSTYGGCDEGILVKVRDQFFSSGRNLAKRAQMSLWMGQGACIYIVNNEMHCILDTKH